MQVLNSLPDTFDEGALTRDAFLGGILQLFQPRAGYRAGVDPVLLAASIPARAGQTVLELGCGGGVASLALAKRVQGIAATGVEILPAYADLARRNAASNDLDFEVICTDLRAMPMDLKQRQFDHVFANPPYYDRAKSVPAQDAGREAGMGEAISLADWVDIAARRCAPKGLVTFIQRADRLPHLLTAMYAHLGSVQVQPFAPRVGKSAHLVVVRGKKLGRADFCLHAPIVMHDGPEHVENGNDYSEVVEAALRSGAMLPFGAAAQKTLNG